MFRFQMVRDGGFASENWISNLRPGPQARPQQPTMPAEMAQATPAGGHRNLIFLFLDIFSITFELQNVRTITYSQIRRREPGLLRAPRDFRRVRCLGSCL